MRETLRKNGFAIFFDIASAHARLAPGVQLYPRPRGTFERGITRMTAAFAILVGLAVFGTARKGKRDG